MGVRKILLVVSLLAIAQPGFAYLDPGAGSMLLQVILGGAAAVGVVLKLYWHKLRAALGFGRNSDAEDNSAHGES